MEIDKTLLDRYLDNNCTSYEKEQVEIWMNENPKQEEQEKINLVWTTIKAEINIKQPAEKPLFKLKTSTVKWFAIAASLLIILSVGILGIIKFTILSKSIVSGQMVTIVTKAGDKKVVTLADGTIVTLNSSSTLSYPEHFTGHKRIVSLSGEAYFEVARDVTRPFQISTDRSLTTVLGTVFNLKDYKEDHKSTLTLIKGRVEFTAKKTGEKCIVTPNIQAVVDPVGKLSQRQVYPGTYNGWKEDRLIFHDQSLKEIIPVLQRWFGIKIVLKNTALASRKCVGTYQNPSLNEVLQSLGFILHFHYQTKDKNVLIY